MFVQNAVLQDLENDVINMAEVLLVYEIRPETPETTPKDLEKKIRKNLSPRFKMQNDPEEKPLFFGLVGIVGQFIIPEEDGAQDELEEFLNSLEEVSSIQMTFVTRL
jgi:translation elongation factor aEF-1 beta